MTHFADLHWRGRTLHIEYQWLGLERGDRPLLVFLHEGLGSVDAWKDFPERVCDATQTRGLVYSRPGYGRSTELPGSKPWAPDFMHQHAHEVLPALLRVIGVEEPPWLFGHSDGGSIALLYAARFSRATAGLVLLAPHIFVEQYGLDSISRVRQAYLETDLKERLARYHRDVDSTFWRWNDIWLDPRFADWTIEHEIASITCPVLAMQGSDDEYGTLDQVRGIVRRVPRARALELAGSGHRLHRDQPARVIDATVEFIQSETNRCDSTAQPSS